MSEVKEQNGSRRDFLYVSTAAAGAITVGGAIWPLINQMNPSADVAALSSIEVDVKELEPGLLINTGHYRNGVLLAPACAEWIGLQIEANKY